MASRIRATTPGIGLFAVFVFVLTAAPRTNVRIGPMPLYLVDVLMVGVILYALGAGRFPRGGRPFQGIVFTLFVFAMLGELSGALQSGGILDAVYLAGRTALAFLTFYAASQLVRGPKDLELVLKAAVLGLSVTAVMMILTSLPMTRGFVASHILSIEYIEPAASTAAEAYLEDTEGGVRGRTLVGVSILGASFINALWPLGALLLRWPGRLGTWRTVALAACLLAPMGVLMSYSRGPILGTILIVLCVVLFGIHRIRRGILLPVAVGTGIVLFIGIGSQIFFFDRLTNRTQAVFEDPLADERESERLLAYSEPFAHAAAHPLFLVIGEGNAIRRTDMDEERSARANHALLAQAYYTHGMIAAFLYIYLIFAALLRAYRYFRRSSSTVGAFYSQAVLLSLVAILPWAAFGHSIVSETRGTMLFFLLIGLLASLRHFPMRPVPPWYIREAAHAYGRRIAV
jgi:hypothetical protein